MGRTKLGPYCRVRKATKPIAEIILRVRKYFEQEKELQRSLNLTKVFERTSEAPGFSREVLCKVKSKEDVDNWKFDDGDSIGYKYPKKVPEKYASLIRFAFRELILEKIKYPTLDTVLYELKSLRVVYVHHLGLFEDNHLPDDTEIVWKWGRTTLYRFMYQIGSIYDDRITHFEFTKSRSDVVAMRDNNLEWIAKYRREGY